MKYRREIDGLRALAVLPVILFHGGFQVFSGGFIGVDVFFVISGYLITTIIITEMKEGTFSFLNFYERRVRRILPALFLVLLVSIIFGWMFLLPEEMKNFGQSIAAAAVFVVNIYFYKKNDDYFGLQAEQNPTLHLWSLSVEEQYYLIFPLLLFLIWRLGLNRIFYVFLSMFVISLTVAQWVAFHNSSAAFFLLPTRGWELLIGSLMVFLPQEQYRLNRSQVLNQLLSILGIGFIIIAIFYFNNQRPLLGFWYLLPTIGAALIILFSTEHTIASKILGSKIFVGIGIISYSAYLWHQPLFAFNRIINYQKPSQFSFFVLAILTLGLSYLSWRFVERPFRLKNRFNRTTVFSLALCGSIFFFLFGIVGYFTNGYPNRDSLYQRLESNFGLSRSCNGNYSINPTCSITATPEVAFLGNSYAMHWIEGFKSTFPNISFVQLTQDTCAPNFTIQDSLLGKLGCAEFYKRAVSTILKNSSIKFVIISSTFGELQQEKNVIAFEVLINTLKAAHKKIIIIGSLPSNGTNFGKCYVHHRTLMSLCNFDPHSIDAQFFKNRDFLKSFALRNHIEFVDPTNLICNSRTCEVVINGIMIYRDAGHLSREGARYIFNYLTKKGLFHLSS